MGSPLFFGNAKILKTPIPEMLSYFFGLLLYCHKIGVEISTTQVYYRDAAAAFVVFDLTRIATFEAAAKWKDDLDMKVETMFNIVNCCCQYSLIEILAIDGSPVDIVTLQNC